MSDREVLRKRDERDAALDAALARVEELEQTNVFLLGRVEDLETIRKQFMTQQEDLAVRVREKLQERRTEIEHLQTSLGNASAEIRRLLEPKSCSTPMCSGVISTTCPLCGGA